METLKIRHILPPDGLRALYALLVEPYYRDVPCIERALVDRRVTREDGEPFTYSDTIGRIVNGRIIDADTPIDGSVFWCYTHPDRYTPEEYTQIISAAKTYGYNLSIERAHNESSTQNESAEESDSTRDSG